MSTDINDVDVLAMVGWKPESELPDWVDDEIYRVLYPSSRVVEDGCEFPYISLCGKEIFLICDCPPDNVEKINRLQEQLN